MLAIRSGTLGEAAASDVLVGEFAEPTLDQFEPARRGGCEVQVEPGVLGQPCLDLGVLVGVVVVQDKVDLQRLGHVPVDGAQEDQELFVPVFG
jgi:hypothetical protein